MSTACSDKMLLGRAHAIDVRHFGVVRAVIIEHFTEQTSVSGIILDQENLLHQFRAHLPSACTGNFDFVARSRRCPSRCELDQNYTVTAEP